MADSLRIQRFFGTMARFPFGDPRGAGDGEEDDVDYYADDADGVVVDGDDKDHWV